MTYNGRNIVTTLVRVLHQVESLGVNFDYDGGPFIENGGPIFLYVYKQVSQNIRSFSYLNHL